MAALCVKRHIDDMTPDATCYGVELIDGLCGYQDCVTRVARPHFEYTERR
jgi:hypothetical protein